AAAVGLLHVHQTEHGRTGWGGCGALSVEKRLVNTQQKTPSRARRGPVTGGLLSSLQMPPPGVGIRQELAPCARGAVGRRLPGFIGPVPPPLWIRVAFWASIGFGSCTL